MSQRLAETNYFIHRPYSGERAVLERLDGKAIEVNHKYLSRIIKYFEKRGAYFFEHISFFRRYQAMYEFEKRQQNESNRRYLK